jgi:hypothetical protein
MRGYLATAVVLGGACLVLLASDSHARVTPSCWPFEKLFKHADLVVVVKPVATREATEKDRAVPPKDSARFLTGVVTTFHVGVVVKGEYKEKTLDLVHFRWKDGVLVANSSGMASFPARPVGRDSRHDFLLFLKKGKGGRLEFVSGYDDPLPSVKYSDDRPSFTAAATLFGTKR